MNSVMVDNWVMQEIIYELYDLEEEISDTFSQFLSSIILWDDIYYPDNEMSKFWNNIPSNLNTIIHPINDEYHFFENESTKLYQQKYSAYSDVIAKGAIRYFLLSNHLNHDYFPSLERQTFLKQNNPYGIIKNLTRLDFLNPLNNAITQQYEEMFMHFDNLNFHIERPILTDFILQNKPYNMSCIDYALHLKYEGPIVKYRNYLSDLETALNNNDYRYLIELIQYSQEIVNNVITMDKRTIVSGEFQIFPSISINLAKDFHLTTHHAHLTFLDNLARFAFNGRKI